MLNKPMGEPMDPIIPFENDGGVVLTPKVKYLNVLSWNVNSWNNVKPYVKGCINSCSADVICIQ